MLFEINQRYEKSSSVKLCSRVNSVECVISIVLQYETSRYKFLYENVKKVSF